VAKTITEKSTRAKTKNHREKNHRKKKKKREGRGEEVPVLIDPNDLHHHLGVIRNLVRHVRRRKIQHGERGHLVLKTDALQNDVHLFVSLFLHRPGFPKAAGWGLRGELEKKTARGKNWYIIAS
jgi:hypothetical protein